MVVIKPADERYVCTRYRQTDNLRKATSNHSILSDGSYDLEIVGGLRARSTLQLSGRIKLRFWKLRARQDLDPTQLRFFKFHFLSLSLHCENHHHHRTKNNLLLPLPLTFTAS